MKKIPAGILTVIVGLAALAFSGCSTSAKVSRFLASADQHYAAGELDKAEVEYLNVLKLQPLNGPAIGRLGLIYTAQGRTNRAVAYVLKAAELTPDDIDVRLKAAQIYAAMGKPAEARAAAEFVLEKRPADSDAPLVLISTLTSPAEVEPIRAKLKGLPAPAPTQAPVIVALAALDLRLGKLTEAEALLDTAKAADPKYPHIYSTLAAIQLGRKNVSAAAESLRQAAALAPPRSPLLLQYAQFRIRTGNADEGRKVMQDITRKTPDYVPAWVALGELSLAEKKLKEGGEFIDKAITLDPQNFQALVLKGRLFNEKGEYEKSISLLEKLVESYPRVPFVHQELGRAYSATGDLNRAISSLGQAVSLAPDSPDAILLLAQLQGRKGDYNGAIALLRRLVEQRPDLPQARLLLADAYRALNNLDAALALYQQLEEQQPRNPQFPLLRGLVYAQAGTPEKARVAFESALKLSPGNASALEQIVNLDLKEGRYPAARTRIDAEVARDANLLAVGELLRAKTYLAEGNESSAEMALKKSIENNPESPTAYFLLAGVYARTNKSDAALNQLDQVLKRDPKQTSALILSAIINDQKGDHTKARDGYEKLLALDPRSAVALNNLAYIYSEKIVDLDRAQDLAQKARQLLPNDPRTADTLGWISYKKRQLTWAMTLLQEAAEKAPGNAEIQYHAGEVAYAIGNESAARLFIGRALELDGSASWAAQAKRALAVIDISPTAMSADAEKLVDEALAENPGNVIALQRKASVRENNGKFSEAIQVLEPAKANGAGNVQLMLTLARLHQAVNEREKALDYAKAARKLAPNDPQVARSLGRLALDNKDFGWGATLFQEAARQLPTDSTVQFEAANALYAAGKVSDAITNFREVVHLEANVASGVRPHTAAAEETLALISLADNPPLAGDPLEERVLSRDPKSAPALMARASRLEHQGKASEAMSQYESVLSIFPDFVPAKLRLAILASQLSSFESRYYDWAAQSRAAFPGNKELARALGILTYRKGDYARALSLLRESSANMPDDAQLAYFLGMAQLQAKDSRSAKISLAKAIQLKLPKDLQTEAEKTLKQIE